MEKNLKIPKHVAIIMDGNRRWAKKQGKKSVEGHDHAAMNVVEPIIEHCAQLNIPYVTFWAFSTENWKRDKDEIQALFSIFRKGLKTLADRFIKKGARLNVLGQVDRFPQDIAQKVQKLIQKSKNNDQITVSFALNYGGRDEVLRAVKKIIKKGYQAKEITEELFSSMLDTADLPDPDLIIRTGGEVRLSGFLPWQSVYSELYFTDTLFPDFDTKQFNKALQDYTQRDRRFGGNSKKKNS